jgi:hypothetical protein
VSSFEQKSTKTILATAGIMETAAFSMSLFSVLNYNVPSISKIGNAGAPGWNLLYFIPSFLDQPAAQIQ